MTEKEQAKVWYALEIDIADEAREAIEYALMEAGALGTHTQEKGPGRLAVTGYFVMPPELPQVQSELANALHIYNLPASVIGGTEARTVPNEDWLAEWKKNWQPVIVGRFYIAPPWKATPPDDSLTVILIEPGMAFGTGTHETTKLCLAAIEKCYTGGTFLDVGTGTGILSIAAAKLFPTEQITACDNDAEAVVIARENAIFNGTSQIDFRTGTLDESYTPCACVVANLTADVIAPLLPQLIRVTAGHLILSGILAIQEDFIRGELRANGVHEVSEITRDGEWIALVLEL